MMKTLTPLTLATALTLALNANATLTVSGTALQNLHYSSTPGTSTAQYYPAGGYAPAEALLTTSDAGNADSPAAYIRASTVGLTSLGSLNNLVSATYHTINFYAPAGTTGLAPYWLTYLNDPNGGYVGVVSMGGATLNANSPVHVFYDYASNPSSTDTHWGITLGQLMNTAYGSTTFGQLGLFETGVSIGDWGTGADGKSSSAAFDSLSVNLAPVPEPTTLMAGALLLAPLGATTVRLLRRNKAGKARC